MEFEESIYNLIPKE